MGPGCGTPVPDCGLQHVLEGIALMFGADESAEYVLWYRDRLVELLRQ